MAKQLETHSTGTTTVNWWSGLTVTASSKCKFWTEGLRLYYSSTCQTSSSSESPHNAAFSSIGGIAGLIGIIVGAVVGVCCVVGAVCCGCRGFLRNICCLVRGKKVKEEEKPGHELSGVLDFFDLEESDDSYDSDSDDEVLRKVLLVRGGTYVPGYSGMYKSEAAAEPRRINADGNSYTRAQFVELYGGTEEWDAREQRVEVDGNAYTRAEFIEHYGGTDEWDAAEVYHGIPHFDEVIPHGEAEGVLDELRKRS